MTVFSFTVFDEVGNEGGRDCSQRRSGSFRKLKEVEVASRIGFGDEEGYEVLGGVDEDFEGEDLDSLVIVMDGDAQEMTFASSLFWFLPWWGGVEGRGRSGRGGKMVDKEALRFRQRCS